MCKIIFLHIICDIWKMLAGGGTPRKDRGRRVGRQLPQDQDIGRSLHKSVKVKV